MAELPRAVLMKCSPTPLALKVRRKPERAEPTSRMATEVGSGELELAKEKLSPKLESMVQPAEAAARDKPEELPWKASQSSERAARLPADSQQRQVFPAELSPRGRAALLDEAAQLVMLSLPFSA